MVVTWTRVPISSIFKYAVKFNILSLVLVFKMRTYIRKNISFATFYLAMDKRAWLHFVNRYKLITKRMFKNH